MPSKPPSPVAEPPPGPAARHRGRRRAAQLTALLLVVGSVGLVPASPGQADSNEAPGAPPGFQAISAGEAHNCVVLSDGSVGCWGDGDLSQLALEVPGAPFDYTYDVGEAPGDMAGLGRVVLGTGRTARAIAAGGFHSCVLLDNDTVKCWGNGALGQDSPNSIGNFAGQMAVLPPINLGPARTATAIATSVGHTCALLDDATVKCWGSNLFGQLGQGNTDYIGDGAGEMAALAPIDLGPGRTATAITAGAVNTCALLDDGTVKCWGVSDFLGLGLANDNRGDDPGEMAALPPVDLGPGRTATAISAGNQHVCALLDDDTVKCWGNGLSGQLGQGSSAIVGDQPGEMGNNLLAVDLGVGRTATAVTAGGDHACALLDNDTVKCWGNGANGRLGQDTTANIGDAPGEIAALDPVNLGVGRTATAVTAGGGHTCALLDNARVKCWGANTDGQLGQGSTANLGDQPGEMAALAPITLGGLVSIPEVEVALTADPATVLAGEAIDYAVTVTNTGVVPLTGITVHAPDVADCEQPVPQLAAGAAHIIECSYTTTPDDVPQMTNQVLVTTAQRVHAVSGTRRTPVEPIVFQPDAQLRLGAGALTGNGTYNTTGAGQARTTTVPNLGTATFTVRIQNDSNVPETFTVKGLGATTRYAVTYKDGGTNVTTAVVAGNFTTGLLAPGATQDLTLIIKAKAGTPVGAGLSRLVTVTSTTDSTEKDAVKATVTRR